MSENVFIANSIHSFGLRGYSDRNSLLSHAGRRSVDSRYGTQKNHTHKPATTPLGRLREPWRERRKRERRKVQRSAASIGARMNMMRVSIAAKQDLDPISDDTTAIFYDYDV